MNPRMLGLRLFGAVLRVPIVRNTLRAMTAPIYTRARTELLAHLPPGSVGAEVGVWRGEFSQKILTEVRPRTLHLIDPWRYQEQTSYSMALYGGLAGSQAVMDDVHHSVCGRFRAEITAGQVVVHRGTSAEVLPTFADASLEWCYLDGDHLYEAVLADLELAHQKVRPGGFLCGDDFGVPGWWNFGVTRAVSEFMRKHGYRFEYLKACQWLIRAGQGAN